MKTLKNYKLITFFFALSVMLSCVKDDDYDVPNTDPVAPVIDGTIITIDSLFSLFLQNDENPLTFTESDLYISGFVISNDEAGNFFEELIIQDTPANPTRGVKVLIDVNPLFTTFEFGRKVFVRLDGLTVGTVNGVLTLGFLDAGSGAQKIPQSLMPEIVTRDVVLSEITPLTLSISDFDIDKTNLYIHLSDVQFTRNDVLGDNRKTFAAEPGDEFDGERILESCASQSSTILSTSTFADFKSLLLPQGRGSLDGILTLNFFGEDFNIVINTPETINFDNPDRCDPDFFFCTTESGGGTAFYSEDFEAFNSIEDYVDAGWTNVNVSGGNTLWEIGNFNNSNYAQISGFNTGEDEIDVWLVTPSINMDTTTKEELLFDIQSNYDNGTILSVLFSTDFTGDVTTSNWEILDATIPVGPSGGFGDFEPVGPINISCIDGTINIAFLYEGSDPNATTRYHVDKIQITGN